MWGCFKKLHNVIFVVEFELCCLAEVDRFENFKMETYCMECMELGNVTF